MTGKAVFIDVDGILEVIPTTVPMFGPNSAEMAQPGIDGLLDPVKPAPS